MVKNLIAPKVYVDTCLFYNVIKRERGLWGDALKVLLAADRNDIKLVASTLVLVEVSGWKGDVDPVRRDEVIDRYLQENVDWYEVDMFVARDIRKYCGPEFGMRGPDAAHLATAIRANADYLMTRDTGFPIGTTVGRTKIVEPTVVWNPTLEDVDVDQRVRADEGSLLAAEGRKVRLKPKPTKPRVDANQETASTMPNVDPGATSA